MRYLPIVMLLWCVSCSTAPKAVPLATPGAASSTPLVAVHRGPVIARIHRRNEMIVVRAGATEATYSLETARGETLVPDMTLGELAQKKPELFQAVQSMQARDIWANVNTDGEMRSTPNVMPAPSDLQSQSNSSLMNLQLPESVNGH